MEASKKKARVLRWIEKQGVRPCCDPVWTGKLLKCVMSVGDVFPDLVRQVSAWYTFWILAQEDIAGEGEPDGICWVDVTKDAGTLFAIGISCEALEYGKEYGQQVLLHELTHVLCGAEHSVKFHETLSGLINQFNAATGSELTNDFYGIETRHDSCPYKLPENIPQQQTQRGNAFRTEAKG